MIFKLPILIPLSCLNFLIWGRIRLLERWYDLWPRVHALPKVNYLPHKSHLWILETCYVSFSRDRWSTSLFSTHWMVWRCWFEMPSDSSRYQFHWASLPSSKQNKKKLQCFLVYDQTSDREGSDEEALVQSSKFWMHTTNILLLNY